MSVEAKFSEVCGENVIISEDKTTATWTPKNSGGWTCCEERFNPGDVIQVKIRGSGRCDIGFMKGEQSPSAFKTLNEIRAHRRACDIEMTFKEDGDEILSNFGDKTFKKTVEKDVSYWVALYIRYGDMSAEIFSKGPNQSSLKFSPTACGKNIKLENDNTIASSISRNPASICFLSDRLQVGESLQLICTPEKEGERLPSRYDIKLHICENDPTSWKDDFKYLFEALEEERNDIPLTTIESFEKDDCNGKIDINLSQDNTVIYKTARGKQNSQTLKFKAENGVWVVFNLYRVRVNSNKNESAPSGNLNQPDSIAIPPRPTYVPPEGGTRHPVPVAVPITNANGDQQRDENDRDDPGRVEFLEQRVKDLERELSDVRLRGQQSNSAQAEPNPNQADTNILTEETGDVLNFQTHFPDLVRSIDTMAMCDHLYARSLLTDGQMEQIRDIFRQSQLNANRELIKILKTKHIEKPVMVEILEKTQQQHLQKLLYPRK